MEFPNRYEPLSQLGGGGGGQVWSVRDRLSGQTLAFKVLRDGATEHEALALVHEATVLSGLEGLGLPRVLAFGKVQGAKGSSGRLFMVRELVAGESLETVLEEGHAHTKWLAPLLEAGEQLAAVHRTGMLHGDIKPANIVVTDTGRGTLVDLGLAAPLASRGVDARGLTPRFAAPELLRGEPLTVRAEVFSFGATLGEALARAGDSFDDDTRLGLARVVLKAKDDDPNKRFPSIDETIQAAYSAAGLSPDAEAMDKRRIVGWPILGIDAVCTRLVDLVTPAGARVVLEGPSGAGRTTLARRAAFTLGVRGLTVIAIERGGSVEALVASLGEPRDAKGNASMVLVVDDYDQLPTAVRKRIDVFVKAGCRLLATGEPGLSRSIDGAALFEIPPLEEYEALELVQRSSPSLAEPLAKVVAERAEFRPGQLRGLLEGLRGKVVVTREDLFLDAPSVGTPRARLAQAIATGRFAEAESIVAQFEPKEEAERLEVELARVRVALARGDNARALEVLLAVETLASKHGQQRLYDLLRSRVFLRRGEFQEAHKCAASVLVGSPDDLFADALSVQGIAQSYLGEHDAALALLEPAVADNAQAHSKRGLGVLWGSLAIVHQRMGKNEAAREAYEAALQAAESANDAWNVATTRLNLAGIERQRGDLAKAIDHLEAAIEMGERAGASLCVLQARLNLANLDLYLGRLAHARGLIDAITRQGKTLSDDARLQLAGLDAEYAERSGNLGQAADRYEACAKEYEKSGRIHEAEEAFLASVLARAESDAGKEAAHDLLGALRKERSGHRQKGKSEADEHEAIARLAEGALHLALLDEAMAKKALDAALAAARASGRSEWIWRTLEVRARLADVQGAAQLARRDREEATAILEETAVKLPKDLREVFWNDPKRRALRAHSVAADGAPRQDSSAGRAFSGITSAFGKAGGMTLSTVFLRDERLAKIFEITRDLAREHDLSRLLGLVTDHAMTLVGAERGFIVLIASDGSFETQSARGVTSEADREFSRSVAERVVRTAEPIATTSAQEDARLKSAVSVHQRMLQSIACVPIRGAPPHGNPIGALYLETQSRAEQRFQAELPMLMAFADQAAIAIENARLLAQNRARTEELAAANAELLEAKDRLAELLGRRTEQLAATRRDLRQVRAEIRSHFGYAGLVGASNAMRRMYAIVDRVKDTDIPVLITGESGTGKEVVAKAIHSAGARSRAVFLGVNCGAIPANLLESELFGHVRGAFTGADHERKGLFREASSGTLLLDEVGELPLSMQASLLRVLQERTVRPVGGNREEPIGTRVIAATNRDLEAMVAEGTFREDLYYRLNVVGIPVPALRERQEDVPLLIDHFLSLFASRYRRDRKSIDRAALRVLSEHDWPGNVRQLEHVLLNAWLMSEGDEIQIEDFPQSFTRKSHESETRRMDAAMGSVASGGGRERSREVKSPGEFRDSEKERILAALARCQWNRVQAAKIVGLPRRTFYRRLKEYGILE
ncbi:MAG: sigma 54-interacting transcriptional regulator [Polyangiaceae bacterium]